MTDPKSGMNPTTLSLGPEFSWNVIPNGLEVSGESGRGYSQPFERAVCNALPFLCDLGEMEIKNPAARPVRLAFYLWRDNNLVHAQDYVQDAPGHFSVTITTDELFSRGKYSIRVLDAFRRDWEEVVTFEIR